MIESLLRSLIDGGGPPAAIALTLLRSPVWIPDPLADRAIDAICARASPRTLELFGPQLSVPGTWTEGARMRLAATLILRSNAEPRLTDPDEWVALLGAVHAHPRRHQLSARDAVARMMAAGGTVSADPMLRALATMPTDAWVLEAARLVALSATPDGYIVACQACPALADEALLTNAIRRGTARVAGLDTLRAIATRQSAETADLHRQSLDPEVQAAASQLYEQIGMPASRISRDELLSFQHDDLAQFDHRRVHRDPALAHRALKRISELAGWSSGRGIPPMPADPQSVMHTGTDRAEPPSVRCWSVVCLLGWAADRQDEPGHPIHRLAATFSIQVGLDARLQRFAVGLLFADALPTSPQAAIDYGAAMLARPAHPLAAAAITGLLDSCDVHRRARFYASAHREHSSWAPVWAGRLLSAPDDEVGAIVRRIKGIGPAAEDAVLDRAPEVNPARTVAFIDVLARIGSRRALGWLCDIELPQARIAEDAIRLRHPGTPATSGAISLAGPSGAVTVVEKS